MDTFWYINLQWDTSGTCSRLNYESDSDTAQWCRLEKWKIIVIWILSFQYIFHYLQPLIILNSEPEISSCSINHHKIIQYKNQGGRGIGSVGAYSGDQNNVEWLSSAFFSFWFRIIALHAIYLSNVMTPPETFKTINQRHVYIYI